MSPHFLQEECETIMEARNQGLTTEPRFLPSVKITSLHLYAFCLTVYVFIPKMYQLGEVSCNRLKYSPTHNKEIALSPTFIPYMKTTSIKKSSVIFSLRISRSQ